MTFFEKLRLCVVAFVCGFGPAYASDESDIEYCLAKAETLVMPFETRDWTVAEHQALMEAHGINCATFFYKLASADNIRLPYEVPKRLYLDRGYPLVITLMIDDGISQSGKSEGTDALVYEPGLLERIVSDDLEQNRIRFPEGTTVQEPRYFTEELRRLADAVAKDNREVYFQIFHEGNGAGWYPWNVGARGNSCALLRKAWTHVHDIFLEAGATNARFVNNLNRTGVDGVLEDPDCFFNAVEELELHYANSVSTYNRCGTSPRYPEERSFAEDFGPMYERLVELSDKPIWVAETSTSGQCAPRIPWFTEAKRDLDDRFDKVARVIFLLGDVEIGAASNEVPIIWGFNGDVEKIRQFRELFGSSESSEEETRQIEPNAPTSVSPKRKRVVHVPTPRQPLVLPPIPDRSVNKPSVPYVLHEEEAGIGRTWRYDGWLNATQWFGDEPIPGYGNAGLVGQGTLRFSYLHPEKDFTHGPFVGVGLVASNTCGERYWHCQGSLEAGYSLLWDLRPDTGTGFGNRYNNFRVDIGVGHRHYWHSSGRPARLDGGDTYGFAEVTWTFGGNLRK